jgi:hypothetical protein
MDGCLHELDIALVFPETPQLSSPIDGRTYLAAETAPPATLVKVPLSTVLSIKIAPRRGRSAERATPLIENVVESP